MLDALGTSGSAASVYGAVVREPGISRRRIAELLELTPGRVHRALLELENLGLIESCDAGRVSVVDPRFGIGALIRSRLSQLDELTTLADKLSAEFREAQLRTEAERLVEVLDGDRTIAHCIADLFAGAHHEILNIYAPPMVTSDDLTGADEAVKLRAGVRIRVLYAAEALESEEVLARVATDVASGEEARALRTVPMKLLVVDRAWAVLPLTSTDTGTRSSAVLVHRSRLTDALVSLFEALWEQAAPITGPHLAPDLDAIEEPDAVLLRLLAAGLKDETIARYLKVSERTLRRRVTAMLERLGAASRFQAGMQAVRRGWL